MLVLGVTPSRGCSGVASQSPPPSRDLLGSGQHNLKKPGWALSRWHSLRVWVLGVIPSRSCYGVFLNANALNGFVGFVGVSPARDQQSQGEYSTHDTP